MADENKEVVSLFDVNRLLYLPSTDASPVINRSIRRQFPQKSSYVDGDVIVLELHGSHFADFSQSSFSFTLTKTAGNDIEFKRGSVLNIFKEVRVVANNGREISRIIKSNLLNYNLLHSKHGASFASNMKEALIFNSTTTFSSKHFTIPLRLLEPFFDNSQLCPPRILEGLRVEITLERPNVAMTDTTTAYAVRNPIFNIDAYELSNQANIILAQMSPLIYEFKTWKHTESTMDGEYSNADVVNSHSLSSALEAILIPRTLVKTTAAGDDSFSYDGNAPIGLADDIDTYIWRWGAVLLPQSVIDKKSDWFSNFLYVNGQLQSKTQDNYNVDETTYLQQVATPVVQLRRSNVLDKSGRELSNQSALLCQVKLASNIRATILDMYVLHVARVVLDGDVVKVEI